MELVVKSFRELTVEELEDIYRLRVAVFVVEQQCPYQEIDGKDRLAYHAYLRDETGIQAYIRVLPKGVSFDEVSLGRVIAVKRGCGLGGQILSAGIRLAREKFGAEAITIEAQVYARGFYEKAGFVQTSAEFLEDGIPHILMRLTV